MAALGGWGLMVIAVANRAVVPVSPADCSPDGDCHAAFQDAISQCSRLVDQRGEASWIACTVEVAPGSYMVRCPPQSNGAYVYPLGKAGAAGIDLSGTHGVTFGGVAGKPAPLVSVDYLHGGCPAVAAAGAHNLTIRDLVLDTVRLPFSAVTVVAASADGREVGLRLAEPDRSEFNTSKYPWLAAMSFSYTVDKCPAAASASCAAMEGVPGSSFDNASWDRATGVAKLHWAAASPPRSKIPLGTKLLVKHFGNMKSWGVYGFNISGAFVLDGVTLLSGAGMGFRCDFCTGDFRVEGGSAIRPATMSRDGVSADRLMSTTADAVHVMHQSGSVTIIGMTIEGAGDDCFNNHGNFIVLANISADRRRAAYIDETGPGWFPQAAVHMVGDRVAFYSRLTLQQIGEPSVLVGASPGYGYNATLLFADPLPAGLLRYDMMLSLDRVASVRVTGSSFGSATVPNSGGRGMLTSGHGVEIIGNVFRNLCANNNLLFLNGGCGAYEDYTEGPFSRDVFVANNTFDRSACPEISQPPPTGRVLNTAMVQWSGCRPVGECTGAASPPSPPSPPSMPEPYPLPNCEAGGSTKPPVVDHAWTPGSGPGRICELGQPLDGANRTIFTNVSMVNNRFLSTGDRFIDVGVAAGITIQGNDMVSLRSPQPVAGGDVHIFASTGYDAGKIASANRCFSGALKSPRACSVVGSKPAAAAVVAPRPSPPPRYTSFRPGQLWLDTDGAPIRAHSGGLLHDPVRNVTYWYGSNSYPDGNAMLNRDINVYASTDLMNWENMGVAFRMPVLARCSPSPTHLPSPAKLGPSGSFDAAGAVDHNITCYADRCKVLRNPTTGRYVMWCKSKPFVSVSVAASPLGPFKLVGNTGESGDGLLLPGGHEVGDCTAFVDPASPSDGYFVLSVHPSSYGFSHGDVRQLKIFPMNEDWTGLAAGDRYQNVTLPFPLPNKYDGKLEAPSVFHDAVTSTYYMWTSHCTYWFPNDAVLLSSPSLMSSKLWERLGNPTSNDSSFSSQDTQLFPVPGRTAATGSVGWIMLADRFEPYVTQNLTGRYVWLPVDRLPAGGVKVHWRDSWTL